MLVYATYVGVANYFLWVQQAGNGVTRRTFERNCVATALGPTPNRLAYSGIGALDHITCILVTFFTPGFGPHLRNYTIDIFGLLGVVILPLMLDSASLFPNSRIATVLAPFITLLFGQLRGLGLSLPLYWLISYLYVFFSSVLSAKFTRNTALAHPLASLASPRCDQTRRPSGPPFSQSSSASSFHPP